MVNKRFISAYIAFMMSFSTQALTIEPGEIIREQQLREQQQLEHLKERPDVFLPQAPIDSSKELPPVTPSGPCFVIDKIQLQGAPHAWLSWLMHPAPAPIPQCMHIEEVKAVVHTLANRILERGYVTSRVDLPPQNLQSGILHITVQPGYVGAIRSPERETDWSMRTAFPIQVGDILNLRDLEQGLEQLARPSTQQAQLDIAPGEKAGTSDIVVTRTRQFPLSGGLSFDNSGVEATGHWQLGGYVMWDRPLQFNDVLILSMNQDSRRRTDPGSRGKSLVYILPWGKWTGSIMLSQYQYQQSFMAAISRLTSSGHTHNRAISLTRLLHRNQTSKTEITGQITQKLNYGFIENIELTNQRRRLSIAGLTLSHRHYIGPVILDASLGVQRGVSWFNAEKPSPLANARQRVYQARIAALLPFKLPNSTLHWSSEWRGQYSPDILFSSEQMSIGNHYTVRGFQYGLAGSSGHYWRNDLSWSFIPPNQQGRALSAYIGVDVGRISQFLYPIDTHTLAGWVIGVRGALSKYAQAELSLESPLHQPASLPASSFWYAKVGINF